MIHLIFFLCKKGDEMGKWVDASEIKMVHDFENGKYREIDIEMRKKPNFDHFEKKKRKDKKKRPDKSKHKSK